MEGNISKKRGLVSEITNDDLDYISVKVEATFKKKADADSVYTKSDIDSLLDGKQDTLTFDSTPTEGSNNPVKSGGIKTELDKKANTSDVYTKTEVDTALDKKADSGSVYTKTEMNTELDKKVSKKENYGLIMGSVYSTGIGNGLYLYFENGKSFGTILDYTALMDILDTKANAADVYTKSETDTELDKKANADSVYTKSEVDTEIENKADKKNGNGGFVGGENALAEDGGAIGKNAHTYTGGAVGYNAYTADGGAVGLNSEAFNGGAIGQNAYAQNGFAGGYNAKTGDGIQNAIQLGEGTNNSEKTLQVYNYQLMDADGHIPNDRMPTKADKSASVPHTTVSGYPMTVTDHLGGENVLDYKIYGNSVQSGTPAADTPTDIQSVGDLVTDTASEYYGKYDIPLYVGGVLTTHIYLNAPLRKVGNSADYIDFKTQKVVRYIKEQTFDGTENWFYRESDTLLYLTAIPNMASSSYCVSTHFLDESRKDTGSTPYVRPVTNVLRLYQQPSNILWSSAAEFKAFLTAQKTAGTPLIVDYVLSTPTEESISAADFSLPDGEIVSMAAGTETAPSKIDLEYYQDINKVIADIKAAILSNGGNV